MKMDVNCLFLDDCCIQHIPNEFRVYFDFLEMIKKIGCFSKNIFVKWIWVKLGVGLDYSMNWRLE